MFMINFVAVFVVFIGYIYIEDREAARLRRDQLELKAVELKGRQKTQNNFAVRNFSLRPFFFLLLSLLFLFLPILSLCNSNQLCLIW